MMRPRNPLIFFAALIAVVVGALWQRIAENPSPPTPPRVETRASAPAPAPIPAEPAAAAETAGGETHALERAVRDDEEREQLIATLALIERGGPYPYDKDGSVFGNREGLLPRRPRGYYREYTVPTPRASNRGARRVVQGREGETYYTRDHYRTFVRLDE
jgi:ribonuclease T1